MTNQQQKNRRTILILFGMTIIPFCIAWYLSASPPSKTTNNGDLIIPVVETDIATAKTEISGFDKFSQDNIGQLSGHWLLVNVIPNQDCKQTCLEAIYSSKQIHLMLSKDLTRVRRLVLLLKDSDKTQAAQWWVNDTRLLRARAGNSLINKFTQINKGQLADGMLFLVDPLGNIMMQYKPGFDPYKVVKDLKKLLSVSQIG
jgi:hypothetical protein